MHRVNPQLKKRALHRARITLGKLQALISSIDKERYCVDLLRESLSIQKALISLDALLLENHLRTHVRNQMGNPKKFETAVKELIEVYKLSNK